MLIALFMCLIVFKIKNCEFCGESSHDLRNLGLILIKFHFHPSLCLSQLIYLTYFMLCIKEQQKSKSQIKNIEAIAECMCLNWYVKHTDEPSQKCNAV